MKVKLETGNAVKKNMGATLHDKMIKSNEFIAAMRDADSGPFMTPQEAMKEYEKWLMSRGKN